MKIPFRLRALLLAAFLPAMRGFGADTPPRPLPEFSLEQRTTEALFRAEEPHESMTLGFFNVSKEQERWRMWYVAIDTNYKTDKDGYLCYAESSDGVNWKRKNQRRIKYEKSTDNNILIAGPQQEHGFNGHHVFRDGSVYRMAYIGLQGNEWWVYGGKSDDGQKWRLSNTPLLKFNSDTQVACIPEKDRYRLYVRMWTGGLYKGTRVIGYTESKTFGSFPEPKVILAPDAQDPKDLHFYNAAPSKLASDLYIMLPTGYRTGIGTGSPYLAAGHDGVSFIRVGREPFLPLGKGFDNKMIYAAPQAIRGERPNTWWVYYIGSSSTHDANTDAAKKFRGGIGRFLLVASPPAKDPPVPQPE